MSKKKNGHGLDEVVEHPSGESILPPQANGKKPAKTARERFLQLAPKRVQAVLDAFVRLGRCGNPAQYEMRDEELVKILHALNLGWDELNNRLKGGVARAAKFSL